MKRWNLTKIILSSIEVFAIILAFQCSYSINFSDKDVLFISEPILLYILVGILPVWLLILHLVKIAGIPTKRYKVLFFLYIQSSIAIFFILILVYFSFSLYRIPRLFLAELPLFGFLFLFFGRILTYKVSKGFGGEKGNQLNVIMIADDTSLILIENILSNKEIKYNVVVIFTDSSRVKEKYDNISIILPERFEGILDDLIEVDYIDEVLHLKDTSDAANVRKILRSCEDSGVTFRLRHNDPKLTLSSAIITYSYESIFLSFINIPNNSFGLAMRKTIDHNLALLMIVVLAPVFLIFSIIIKLTSKGPVVCKMPKIGYRGKQIFVYRFRTMTGNGSNNYCYPDPTPKLETGGAVPTKKPRITLIGKFLLKSGLDQLPSLFNVLKGELKIVGPRFSMQGDDYKPGDLDYL